MFWNKKEDDKKLPDLPSPRSIGNPFVDKDDDLEERSHSLPSFPDSPITPGFSQAAIKDAVADPENEERSFKTIEMEEWSSSPVHERAFPTEAPLAQRLGHPQTPPSLQEKQSEVFVKIEKFRAAKSSLQEIGEKLEDIDQLLKKIRDTKMREEQELSSWEREISAAKSRVQDVRENIFERKA